MKKLLSLCIIIASVFAMTNAFAYGYNSAPSPRQSSYGVYLRNHGINYYRPTSPVPRQSSYGAYLASHGIYY